MIEITSRLPSNYQEVEYIQSSGTQYINLNFIPNQDTGIEMNVIPMQVTAANAGVGFIPYGAGQSYNSNTFECYSTPDGYLEFNYAQQYQTQLVAISIGTKIKIFQNKNNVLVYNEAGNVILNHNFIYSNFTSPRNLVIFGINRGNILCGHQKIYDCKIFNNNNKIYELIPCYRKTDKIAGMYDIINNVFYTNAGTGSFSVGNAVGGGIVITAGGTIPIQYALRRRMMMTGDGAFEFTYTGQFTDKIEGSKRVIKLTSSGTLNVSGSVVADIYLLAGGGGASCHSEAAGGGGGGGNQTITNYTVKSGVYDVTVGKGGQGRSMTGDYDNNFTYGSSGGDTSIFGHTCTGGGGGGSSSYFGSSGPGGTPNGKNGGSNSYGESAGGGSPNGGSSPRPLNGGDCYITLTIQL